MPRPKKKSAAEIAAEQEQTRQREVRIRQALRWTEGAYAPDVAPPDSFDLSTGYVFNIYYGRVEVACSSSVSHAVGQTDRTRSQGARRLFSTRLLALQALRQAMEREFAEKLAAIDYQIEKENA